VPRSIEAAITKALARQPVDRFATVTEFLRAVEAPDSPTIPSQAIPAAVPVKPRMILRVGGAVLVAIALATVALRGWRNQGAGHFDPGVVAILPARINSSSHSLDYLREGLLDLAATRLTGEGGPRAVDARATLAALRSIGGDDPDALARRLGAGRVL